MTSARQTGRIIGVLIFIQMVLGVITNFVLEGPVFDPPGFLVNAAGHAPQLGLAVVLSLITEATWVAVAITAFPIFRQRSPAMALWLIVLAAVILAVAVVENAAVMSLVSLSQTYASANPAERTQLETVHGVVADSRNWPHFIARMLDGCIIFLLYATLYRFAFIPRLLAGFGLIAAALQISGVGLPLFGHDVIFPMLAPLGISQLFLAAWLVTRGLRE